MKMKMLTKEQITQKLKTVTKKRELLNLSNHKALGWYVIVIPASIEEPGITSRVEQFEDRPEVGLVVAVGENVTEISEGNVVFFGKYSTVQMTYDDTTYIILREDDVYCVAE